MSMDMAGLAAESLPVRGAWIEIEWRSRHFGQRQSLPVRGAWIEIVRSAPIPTRSQVAPRAGSVD